MCSLRPKPAADGCAKRRSNQLVMVQGFQIVTIRHVTFSGKRASEGVQAIARHSWGPMWLGLGRAAREGGNDEQTQRQGDDDRCRYH